MVTADGAPTSGGAWRRLAGWLWPPRCLACGGRGDTGRDLCAACADELPWARGGCFVCALPLGDAALPAATPGAVVAASASVALARCRRCRMAPPPFTTTCATFAYRPPVDHWLRRFKFHGDLAAGRLIAQLLADAASAAPRPDAVVPLPLHRGRLRERGYDQALELARPLAAALALPLRADALVRRRATAPQTDLGAAARRRNLRGAFAVRGAPLPRHVALVDDVMTTGATLAEAARTLTAAGVARVDLWVVARAPPRGTAPGGR